MTLPSQISHPFRIFFVISPILFMQFLCNRINIVLGFIWPLGISCGNNCCLRFRTMLRFDRSFHWCLSLLSPLLILALNVFLDWYTMAFSVISFFFFHVRTFSISTPYHNYDCWLNPSAIMLRYDLFLKSHFWHFCFFLIRHSAVWRCKKIVSYRSEYAYYSNINEHIDWTAESLQGAIPFYWI